MRDGWVRSVFAAVVFVAWATTVSADVPGNNRRGGRPPGPPPQAPSTIVVPVEANFKDPLPVGEQGSIAKIVIPRDVLKRLLENNGAAEAPTAAPQPEARNDVPPFGTIVAGSLLALAMVSAGFAWRRSAPSRSVTASAAVLATIGIASTWAFADLSPPKRTKPSTAPVVKKPDAATIIVEMTNTPGPIRLYAPR